MNELPQHLAEWIVGLISPEFFVFNKKYYQFCLEKYFHEILPRDPLLYHLIAKQFDNLNLIPYVYTSSKVCFSRSPLTFHANFQNLSCLHLNRAGLKEIPEFINNLSSLRILDLSSNQLEDINSLDSLSKLEILVLNYNKIQFLSLGNLRVLQYLSLHHNSLTSIPDNLCQLTNLQTLILDHNYISIIPANIGFLKKLKYLYLYHNQIQNIPIYIGELAQLEQVYFDYNQISVLPNSLVQLTQLRVLHLKYNYLTELPVTLGYLPNLQYLNVGFNNLQYVPSTLFYLDKLYPK